MKIGLATIVFLVALLPGQVAAGEVIAHPSVHLSADDIRNVFLGEKQLLGALRLVPVGNSALQAEFLSKVLQTDERKYLARWIRKTFREGVTAPAIKGSDAEVIAFVRATPGAVGYVSGKSGADATIKVLEEF